MKNEIYAEPILVFRTQNETKVLDAIRIWDFEQSCTIESANDVSQFLNVLNIPDVKDEVRQKTREIESFVFDWKIIIEKRKIEDAKAKGQSYLIPSLNDKIRELRRKYKQLMNNLESSKNISWELCGPVGCGIVLEEKKETKRAIKDEELKRKVELVGMNFVIKYERDHGREIRYTSTYRDEFRGYDILSVSKTEERLIEVKSFKSVGEIEISSNE